MSGATLDAESAKLLLDRFGSLRLRVRGGSMGPWLRSGTWVRVVAARADEVRRGEVILVAVGPRLILHRAAERRADGWITRADASGRADSPVPDACVLGRMVGLHLGRLHMHEPPRRLVIGLGRAALRAGPWPGRLARSLARFRTRR